MISGLLHLVLESLGPTMLLQILFHSFSQLSNILVCVCVCVCVCVFLISVPGDMKSQLIGKTLMLGKTDGRRRRG